MEPAPHAPRCTRAERAVVALLLLAHVLLLLDGARRDALTFDESFYIAGGVVAWRTGDLRIAPDIGELPQRLAALPLVLAGIDVPDLPDAIRFAKGWPIGDAIVYDSGLAPETLALLARLPFILLSGLLGWIVHAIARRVFGCESGLLALTLYAFSPAFLAHGRLATADLPITLSMTAFAWLLGRCLERATPSRGLASALALGLAFVAKMSAVLLLPIAAVIALVRLAARAPIPWSLRRAAVATSLRSRLVVMAAIAALHAVLVVAVIWAFHEFREAPANAPGPTMLAHGGWDAVPREGAVARTVTFAREHHVLPEAWLFGFQFTELHSHERHAYAMGRWSMTGWPWFFPLAFLLKTPLATLLLVLMGLVALAMAWRGGLRATIHPLARDGLARWATRPWGADLLVLSPLLALLIVYWAIALRTPLAIGHRHVLPTMPATLILASAAAGLARHGRHGRLLVRGVALVAAIEGIAAHPFDIAYMNPLAGSPERRWTRLVDSSLDWGQDARRVAVFLAADAREHGDAPAWLSWFGASDPAREGTVAHGLPSFHDLRPVKPREMLSRGTYVVSATMLVQVYSNFPGTWAVPYEDAWRRADALARPYLEADEAGRRRLEAQQGDDYWARLLGAHEQLRFARLCAWLRHRPPDAVIGDGAVLAWRLTDAQVEEALHGEPVELVDEPVMRWVGGSPAAAP
jgi:4-amino-4-deoxy-L-arabinose transferase-like glycosyltransferase